MLRIKGYPGTSNFPIHSFYRIQNQILLRQGLSNTFILPNIKSNRFTYHVSHQGTSSNFPFIKHVGIQTKISFSRRSHSNTFILPNTKPNRFTYHVSHKGTSSNFPFIKLVGIQTKISLSRKVIPILSFYRIQNQIGSRIMFGIKGQVQISHLSNLQAYRSKSLFRDQVIPILSFYRIQNQILSRQGHSNTSILPNTKLNRLTYHVSHQGTSSNFQFIKHVTI